MKKTNFVVTTVLSMSCQNTTRRVYIGDDGKRYIKTKEGYRCIENSQCIDTIRRED